jgi:hypothetical protein
MVSDQAIKGSYIPNSMAFVPGGVDVKKNQYFGD